jgi:hypothetical protein
MSEPLLKRVGETDPGTLEDLLLIMAKNVEASLLQGGAKPNTDYTIQDLYTWGMPFALSVFNDKESKITFAAGDF